MGFDIHHGNHRLFYVLYGMDWKALLKTEVDNTYRVTAHLLDLVDENKMNWKPHTGSNWLTVGQLINHITEACGSNVKGFVTGDWSAFDAVSAQGPLPPAESFPQAVSVDQVRKQLQEDHDLTLDLLNECSEEDLSKKLVSAPWDPKQAPLGQRILQMIEHLKQHKGQLYYYLKLQGKPVNTLDLWPT